MEPSPHSNLDSLHLITPTYLKKGVTDGLSGYRTLQQIREKTCEYRLGYLNWRKKQARGAKGEHQDVFLRDTPVSNLHPDELSQSNNANEVEARTEVEEVTGDPSSLSRDKSLEDCDNRNLMHSHSGSHNHFNTTNLVETTNHSNNKSNASPDPYCSFPIPQQLPIPDVQIKPYISEVSNLDSVPLEDPITKTDSTPTGSVVDSGQDDTHDDKSAEDHGGSNWLRFYFNPLNPVETPTVIPICRENLSKLPSEVSIPRYSLTPKEWIVHIGVGGFHRSHQAVYMDDILHKMSENHIEKNSSSLSLISTDPWGYCGVGLTQFDSKLRDVFLAQDNLYTVLTRGASTNEARVIGSIYDYIFAPEEPERVMAKLSCEHTRIVSLTVTEKGYTQSTDGHLDVDDDLIKHDLLNPTRPCSAVGLVSAGLMLRRNLGIQPFTVLSCDNLPENGNVIRNMVIEFADRIDPGFSTWISENVSFPCTMVDRITPVTAAEHKEILARDFGISDAWPVVAENYRQWVIEDLFCNLRPPWEQVGVMITSNVRSYEIMKLRLLNGGHSFLAYISCLRGYTFVDDAVNDVLISSFVRRYMDEVTSTIKGVKIELERYKEKIVERFGNRHIKDSLARISEDGSTKIFNTMRDAVKELITEDRHVYCVALALAAWIVYISRMTDSKSPLKDPKAEELQSLANSIMACDRVQHSSILMFVRHVFGKDEIYEGVFINEITVALTAIRRLGMKEVLCCGGPLHALFKPALRSHVATERIVDLSSSRV